MRRKRHVCRSKVPTPSFCPSWSWPAKRFWATTPKGTDLARKIRQLIIERLPTGSANFDAIADVLKMSSKTLERRLAERGQSFSALLDATRCETVKHYLEETDMRLSQVAYMAGYT